MAIEPQRRRRAWVKWAALGAIALAPFWLPIPGAIHLIWVGIIVYNLLRR